MEMKFKSMNNKWEIWTGWQEGQHIMEIKDMAHGGIGTHRFSDMAEFQDSDPARLDKGKNKDVPQSVVQVAMMVAQQIIIQGGGR